MDVEFPDREQLLAACRALPLFPLPSVVFLPNTLLPLHVFEPRYRELVRDVMAGDRILAVPRLLPGWQAEYEAQPPIRRICGVGRIVKHEEMPEGRSNIVLAGIGRVEVMDEAPSDTQYRVARARLRPDVPLTPAGQRVLVQVRTSLAALVQVRPGAADAVRMLLGQQFTPSAFVFAIAHMTIREPDERQEFLEVDAVDERAELVLARLGALMAAEGGAVDA
jgi:Lon protease-like protein